MLPFRTEIVERSRMIFFAIVEGGLSKIGIRAPPAACKSRQVRWNQTLGRTKPKYSGYMSAKLCRLNLAHYHRIKPRRGSQSLPNQPACLAVLLHLQLVCQPPRHQPTTLPKKILLFTTDRSPRPLGMERREEGRGHNRGKEFDLDSMFGICGSGCTV